MSETAAEAAVDNPTEASSSDDANNNNNNINKNTSNDFFDKLAACLPPAMADMATNENTLKELEQYFSN